MKFAGLLGSDTRRPERAEEDTCLLCCHPVTEADCYWPELIERSSLCACRTYWHWHCWLSFLFHHAIERRESAVVCPTCRQVVFHFSHDDEWFVKLKHFVYVFQRVMVVLLVGAAFGAPFLVPKIGRGLLCGGLLRWFWRVVERLYRPQMYPLDALVPESWLRQMLVALGWLVLRYLTYMVWLLLFLAELASEDHR